MTWLPLFMWLLSVAPQGPMPPGTGSISGRVIGSDTGKPLKNAAVQITIYENLSARFQSALTDADGHFELTNLPAGHFRIAASATNYLKIEYGQQRPGAPGLFNPSKAIELHDGDHMTTADFALLHARAIEGKVVDEFGDPVPNATVQVSQVQYAGGRRRMIPVGGSKPTDDRGHFRCDSLVPGDYFVEALSGAFADPNAAGGFAVTFFPGTADITEAKPVTLAADRDLVSPPFALVPAPTTRVSGTIVDADGKPIPNATLMLVPSEKSNTSLVAMSRVGSGPDGSFSFRNVPAGAYTIQAFGRLVSTAGNLGGAAFGWRTFRVDAVDLNDVIIKIPEARTLRGHITFEGGGTLPDPDNVFVSPRPVDFESSPMAGGPSPFKVHPDWTFEVLAMSGRRIIVAGVSSPGGPSVPSGWLLKRAMINGEDVTDKPLDFRDHDVDDIELFFSREASKVTGTVSDDTGKAVAEYNVVIFAEDPTKWGPWSRYVAFAQADAKATFVVVGLPPGSYLAVATGTLANGEWQDPEFLKSLAKSGGATPFVLGDNESKTLQLKMQRDPR